MDSRCRAIHAHNPRYDYIFLTRTRRNNNRIKPVKRPLIRPFAYDNIYSQLIAIRLSVIKPINSRKQYVKRNADNMYTAHGTHTESNTPTFETGT